MSKRSTWSKAIMKAFRELTQEGPWGIDAEMENDDSLTWSVDIMGPKESPYEGGIFKGTLTFTEEYPFERPTFNFRSSMFHPNISVEGKPCMDFASNWSPCHTIWSFLAEIQFLLLEPNPEDSSNTIAAEFYLAAREEYDEQVKQCVRKSLTEYQAMGIVTDDQSTAFLSVGPSNPGYVFAPHHNPPQEMNAQDQEMEDPGFAVKNEDPDPKSGAPGFGDMDICYP